MGASVSSVFDCSVNPLAAAPPEDGDSCEGPPRPTVLEPPTPLRDSALWRLQRAFYEAKGARAWSEAIVPNFVTTNSFIARAYAKLILGLLRDTFELPPRPVRAGERAPHGPAAGGVYPAGTDPTQPVYIIELGAGHGKQGYLIVETLLRYRSFFPACAVKGGVPFKYVLTDAFPAMVESWRAHPSLKDFFDMGVLDVAVFDAERDASLTCQLGGECLAPGAPQCANPMLVIANYTFDSLTTDAFRISPPAAAAAASGSGGAAAAAAAGSAPVLEQACVALTSLAPEDRPQPPASDNDGDEGGARSSSSSSSSSSSRGGGDKGAGAAPPSLSTAAIASIDPGLLARIGMAWSYVPLRQQQQQQPADAGDAPAAAGGGGGVVVYNDPLLDGLLTAYLRSPALTRGAAPPPATPSPSEAGALLGGAPPPPLVPPAAGPGASILVPLGGMRALRSLLRISGGKLVAVVGDKGYTRLCDMQGHRDPHCAVHGSCSFMVNFHALKEAARAYGATVLSTPYVDGFKVSALLFGSVAQGAAGTPVTAHLPLVHGFSDAADGDAEAAGGAAASASSASALLLREVALTLDGSVSAALAPATPAPTSLASAGAPYPLTRWGFRDGLEALTPEDFSTLQRCVKEECPNPSVKHLLALLRLANHDAEVFYKFKQVLIDKSAYPQVHDNLARDLRGDVDRVYASHFPLVPSKDVSFELGRMLMGLRDYASAIEFFNKSHETCGAHHITWHNVGVCFYYLEDYDSALQAFRSSLELSPDYGEARLWWERTAMKQGSSAAVATAAGPGSDGEGDEVDGGAGSAAAQRHPHDAAFDGGSRSAL